MRLLVIGDSLGQASERLRLASLGLALRGHEVVWSGEQEPPSISESADPRDARLPEAHVRRIPGGLQLARIRAELVVGAGSPARVAMAGWLAGTNAMVLGLDGASVGRWTGVDRWCWESLDAIGLKDAADLSPGAPFEAHIESGRLVEWSVAAVSALPSAVHPDTEILERRCEGLRARAQGRGPRAAVFLDRDGTLVIEKNYLATVEGLELLSGVPEALRMLHAHGYALVVVSNQSGVGRGLFPLERVYETMAALRTMLRDHGLELDGIYFCPHRPDEGCSCRKPGTALLERAAADLSLDLRRSVMIGDKLIDVSTGQRAGARGILVRTGYGSQEEPALAGLERPPDHVVDDLAGAARWLLEQEGPRESD